MKEEWANSDCRLVFFGSHLGHKFGCEFVNALVFHVFQIVQRDLEALLGMVENIIKIPTTFIKKAWAENDWK